VLANRPGACVHLVESNGRKAAFLREVIRTLNLPAEVHNCRIEDAKSALPETIDCVTARALASLKELLEMQVQISKKPCKSIYLKGQDIEFELTEAAKYWSMEYQIFPSVTDPAGHVLLISRAERR
jgi:16S rRNA (guanine527-N7)-methyltransferase